MAWKPAILSREQMEERRREGARLIRSGRLSHTEIARQLEVSRRAVANWVEALQTGGLRHLRRRKAKGRPARLTRSQQSELKRLIRRGALAAGLRQIDGPWRVCVC